MKQPWMASLRDLRSLTLRLPDAVTAEAHHGIDRLIDDAQMHRSGH
jgi:hypothetical protein